MEPAKELEILLKEARTLKDKDIPGLCNTLSKTLVCLAKVDTSVLQPFWQHLNDLNNICANQEYFAENRTALVQNIEDIIPRLKDGGWAQN